MLVLGLVRNAMSWALSMYAKPWHTSPQMQALPFSDFIRAPWDTRVDRARYFPDSDKRWVRSASPCSMTGIR